MSVQTFCMFSGVEVGCDSPKPLHNTLTNHFRKRLKVKTMVSFLVFLMNKCCIGYIFNQDSF